MAPNRTSHIAALPKAELHLHLEGTLEPDLIFRLADRNRVVLPYRDEDDLRDRYRFTDLQSFLDLYYANMKVLRTAEDFWDLADAYLARAQRAGVTRAEVFVDPQAHVGRGVPLPAVLDGIGQALAQAPARHGISAAMIVAFLRDRPPAEALALLPQIIAADPPLLGVGLDSAEIGYPPELFTELFAVAGAAGLHRVAHAGEEGPADYIRGALDLLHAERIDHGIRVLEDRALTDRMAASGTPLTVCPLSNVRLRTVPTLAAHPLPALLDAGLRVTINSDDPAYFGGYIDDNFAAVARTFGLTDQVLAELAGNSFRAAFIDDRERGEALAAVDAWLNDAPAAHPST